jgi:hypothetical protein
MSMTHKIDAEALRELVGRLAGELAGNEDAIEHVNDVLVEHGFMIRGLYGVVDSRRPPYVRVGLNGTAMRRQGSGYYREWGAWGVGDVFVDGRHVASVPDGAKNYCRGVFHGLDLIPISREEYLKDGGEPREG